jgi:predicted DNA binding protein
MAQSVSGVRLTLELWHPGCWAIEATESAGGGVLAHAVYDSPTSAGEDSTARGLFTAYADDADELAALLDRIERSDSAGEVMELQERFGRTRNTPGNVAREFFLEYDPEDMVCPTLLKHGFVHSAPVRIEDGSETWQVCFAGDHGEVEDALDDVCDQADAEVDIRAIRSGERGTAARNRRLDTLTAKQREVFEYARAAGYYGWPRETSTRDLASDLDIAKTTLLEHLRTAESKLLDPNS